MVTVMDPFVKKMEETIQKERLFEPGSCLVVAVSGGPDSVAMVSALLELAPSWRLELLAAHLNHGLRGKESDADEQWVRELAEKLSLPLVTRKLKETPAKSLESSLRARRYQFLLSVAKEAGARHVAVGHHADDQAETVLINLIRGSGPTGLSGMAPIREAEPGSRRYIIRPLLGVCRREILDYLGRAGLGFREDSSNLDPRYLRNRIRHQLLPLLESINPGIKKTLARTAEISRQEERLIREEARRWLESCARDEGDFIFLDINPVAEALPGLRMAVYREAIRAAAGTLGKITLTHLEAVDRLLMHGPAHGALDLPGILVRREYRLLRIGPALNSIDRSKPGGKIPGKESLPLPLEKELAVPGSLVWKGPFSQDYAITSEYASPPGRAPDPAAEAWLDPAKLSPPLKVRSRRPGDRYRPAGMTGSRKLKDIMNQLKIPPRERDSWPLIVDREKIVWIPGFRPAESARPDLKDNRQLKLSVNPSLLS